MPVRVTIRVQGRPLKRTYVSHTRLLPPETRFFRTNDAGEVTISGETGPTRITVHCQNTVVRVLDGDFLPVPVEVTQSFDVSHDDVVDIRTTSRQRDHFRILEQCLTVYDRVYRQFAPFNRAGRRAFPFGQGQSVRDSRDRLPRIEVVYPDNSVAPVAWTEPASVGTGYPLVHVKDRSLDDRLFGRPGLLPSLIPHELAHALHFAIMPAGLRALTQTQYGAWIAGRLAQGLPAAHNTELVTTPFVAWIESVGLFGERLFAFADAVRPNASGVALRRAFFRSELSAQPELASVGLGGYLQVGRQVGSQVTPALTGDDVEGSVYGAVFLDLARRFGLREIVGRYFTSVDDNVLTVDDFTNALVSANGFRDGVLATRTTWGL